MAYFLLLNSVYHLLSQDINSCVGRKRILPASYVFQSEASPGVFCSLLLVKRVKCCPRAVCIVICSELEMNRATGGKRVLCFSLWVNRNELPYRVGFICITYVTIVNTLGISVTHSETGYIWERNLKGKKKVAI